MYYLSLSKYTYGDTGIMEMDWATGSIYLGVPGVDRHHLIIWNTHSINPHSWSHALWPRVHGSTQFVSFIMAVYPFISCHPLPILLELEPLCLTNSFRMPCEVRRSVEDGLSALYLHCFTTPWSSELRDAFRGRDPASLEAVFELVWGCTWRL